LLLAAAFHKVLDLEPYGDLLAKASDTLGIDIATDSRHRRGAGLVLLTLFARDTRTLEELMIHTGLRSAGLDGILDRLAGRPEPARSVGGSGRERTGRQSARAKISRRRPAPTALIERVIDGPETMVRLTDRGRELRRYWRRIRAKTDGGPEGRVDEEILTVLREGLAQLVETLGNEAPA
jgi:hypothetical protein